MTLRVDGKVIIVTGSTQGLGEAMVHDLADHGAAGLVVTGRSRDRGGQVVAALEKKGTKAIFVEARLEDPNETRRIVAACDERFGRVDGLVNSAGITDRGTIEDTSVELFDRLMAVNVRAPFILMQECVKRMKRDGRPGSIASVASMSAHGGQPFLTPYSTSKGALVILTKNVANAVRRHRIRVNVINLGWTDTPAEHAIQQKEGKPADWLSRAEATQPFGRLIRPIDCARLTTYLMSDDSEMMTGAAIDLDQNVMGAYD
jgi:NAD(P)-dependent dehydrogenase (short-subunit alcohol dehydrogenase family)